MAYDLKQNRSYERQDPSVLKGSKQEIGFNKQEGNCSAMPRFLYLPAGPPEGNTIFLFFMILLVLNVFIYFIYCVK